MTHARCVVLAVLGALFGLGLAVDHEAQAEAPTVVVDTGLGKVGVNASDVTLPTTAAAIAFLIGRWKPTVRHENVLISAGQGERAVDFAEVLRPDRPTHQE